jgi:hypothetical protein
MACKHGWVDRLSWCPRLKAFLMLAGVLVGLAMPLFCGAQNLAPFLAALKVAGQTPACLQQRLRGACFCGAVPCGFRVQQFVPVAIVETTRAPGDSIFLAGAAAAGPLAGVMAGPLSDTEHTAEVHVWLITDVLAATAPCILCKPSSARRPAPARDLPVPACGSVDEVLQTLGSGFFAGARELGWPVLAYASEADALNWHTGCRDLASVVSRTPWDCQPDAVAAPDSDPVCLGGWGFLKPRQMRDIGLDAACFSAKTSVRGMSLARTALGTFPYPVDLHGYFQQVYPTVSTCFKVGERPLPQRPARSDGVSISTDGRYAWVYWRPTTCCVATAATLAACTATQMLGH